MRKGLVGDLVPARILNDHVFCPRAAYIKWVEGQFDENEYTAEGSFVHRRVHQEGGSLPLPEELGDLDRGKARVATLSSDSLGIIAKVDLIEIAGKKVVPIEYKRGSPRDAADPVRENDKVQLCAQVLLLREAGYHVDHGEVYFAGSRTRHTVSITDDLIAATKRAVAEVRSNAARPTRPDPLVDSPKCKGCSLVGLCLPDETNLLSGRSDERPRRLVAADAAAQPLYASSQGSRLSKRGERVVLMEEGQEAASRRLLDVSHIALFGAVDASSALLRECLDRGIPVLWLTYGGWLKGFATGLPKKNIDLRIAQFRSSPRLRLGVARRIVAGKIRNSRTLLRRNLSSPNPEALDRLAAYAARAERITNPRSLLGIEGTAAKLYFSEFPKLLRANLPFRFEERNRRPPRDEVNALLSFCYSLLVKDATAACIAVGLEPLLGLYHEPRFGKPALALDLAEEFRPLIADSVVIRAINTGVVTERSFEKTSAAVALRPEARRELIGVYEHRMRTELQHPVFGYKASYRRTLEIQARLLAAVLTGQVGEYTPVTTR